MAGAGVARAVTSLEMASAVPLVHAAALLAGAVGARAHRAMALALHFAAVT